MTTGNHGQRPPVLAAIVHDVLRRAPEPFVTLADLVETVKCRAARLRIPYDAEAITTALALVARSRPLLATSTPRVLVERPPDPPVLSRDDARAIVRRLGVAVGIEQAA